MAGEILTPEQLSVHADAGLFSDPVNGPSSAAVYVGQERAAAVLRAAFAMPGEGYHLLAVGKEGTARIECIKSVADEQASRHASKADRVLLPQPGQPSAYVEARFKPGLADAFIRGCQHIVDASINAKPAVSETALQMLQQKHDADPVLSDYLQWLEQETLAELPAAQEAGEQGPARIKQLHNMLPVLLISSRLQTDCLLEAFPDAKTLLGTVHTDEETGRVSIHCGALFQASAGILIIDGRQLLKNRDDWYLVREILKTGRIPLNKMTALQPGGNCKGQRINGEVSLTARVVFLCDSSMMDKLYDSDPEIENVFSAVAEFESEMERNDENCIRYAALLSSLVEDHQCLPLDAHALAAMIDLAARITDCQHRLTLNRPSIIRLLRDASLQASLQGDETISRQHIHAADRLHKQQVESDHRDALQAIIAGETRVDLCGSIVGQINGLTIVGTGVQSYLEPSRITATVRAGDGAVVDIEREVSLGGSIHSKGVMILASLLAARYSRHLPLSLVATLVFEQSYSDVDGDSASAAEMMAILSAVTEVPVKQALAVTGSIDQRGQILCVGDINTKIDGYYQLSKMLGNGDAGVVIPAGNMRDLMLDDELLEAVAEGRFVVTAVSTLDDLIEIFTGMQAGQEDGDHVFPAGSFNDRVQAALKQFSDEKKDEHKDDEHNDVEHKDDGHCE